MTAKMWSVLSIIAFLLLVSTRSFEFRHRSKRAQRKTFVCNAVPQSDAAILDCWRRDLVPRSYDEVQTLMQVGVALALQDLRGGKQSRGSGLFSVDVLTPGLDPLLEQKAMLFHDYLFNLVVAVQDVLSVHADKAVLVFPSVGDKAAYLQFVQGSLPSNIYLSDLVDIQRQRKGREQEHLEIDVVVFISAKNHVGDPILSQIMSLSTELSTASPSHPIFLFLNCDLSDRVTTGIRERSQRDAFRAQIRTWFYCRNLVYLQRPALIPFEEGFFLGRYHREYDSRVCWQVFAVNEEEIVGPGSLNRFLPLSSSPSRSRQKPRQQLPTTIFARDPADPTSDRPPGFFLCAQRGTAIERDEISRTLSVSSFYASLCNTRKQSSVLHGLRQRVSAEELLKSTERRDREWWRSLHLSLSAHSLSQSQSLPISDSLTRRLQIESSLSVVPLDTAPSATQAPWKRVVTETELSLSSRLRHRLSVSFISADPFLLNNNITWTLQTAAAIKYGVVLPPSLSETADVSVLRFGADREDDSGNSRSNSSWWSRLQSFWKSSDSDMNNTEIKHNPWSMMIDAQAGPERESAVGIKGVWQIADNRVYAVLVQDESPEQECTRYYAVYNLDQK